jgi:hypothetical protein
METVFERAENDPAFRDSKGQNARPMSKPEKTVVLYHIVVMFSALKKVILEILTAH